MSGSGKHYVEESAPNYREETVFVCDAEDEHRLLWANKRSLIMMRQANCDFWFEDVIKALGWNLIVRRSQHDTALKSETEYQMATWSSCTLKEQTTFLKNIFLLWLQTWGIPWNIHKMFYCTVVMWWETLLLIHHCMKPSTVVLFHFFLERSNPVLRNMSNKSYDSFHHVCMRVIYSHYLKQCFIQTNNFAT